MPTKTNKTTVKRAAQRASYDDHLIKQIISECLIGHLSFVTHHHSHSIPMPFWHSGEYLYCHCSVNSRLTRLVDHGDVCISFAIIDALVLAKSAFRHSFNYRSVVVYGQFSAVNDDREKMYAMQQFMNLFDKQRWNKIRTPNKKELNATALLKLRLTETVAKVRTGPPKDKQADLNHPVWAGIIPKYSVYGTPEPH